ncbi:hypothetical protein GGF46_002552 [Coemansia sp. RSA 552]|nr:hypothetical protein GGF46_002552 [Coemansia sp. RSA 552]
MAHIAWPPTPADENAGDPSGHDRGIGSSTAGGQPVPCQGQEPPLPQLPPASSGLSEPWLLTGNSGREAAEASTSWATSGSDGLLPAFASGDAPEPARAIRSDVFVGCDENTGDPGTLKPLGVRRSIVGHPVQRPQGKDTCSALDVVGGEPELSGDSVSETRQFPSILSDSSSSSGSSVYEMPDDMIDTLDIDGIGHTALADANNNGDGSQGSCPNCRGSGADSELRELEDMVTSMDAEMIVQSEELKAADKRFAQIAETLQCAICLDTFTRPHSLVCGHVFCLECLAPWLQQNKRCPTCRTLVIHRPAVAFAVQDVIRCLNPSGAEPAADTTGSSADPWAQLFPTRRPPSRLPGRTTCSICSRDTIVEGPCFNCALQRAYDVMLDPAETSDRASGSRNASEASDLDALNHDTTHLFRGLLAANAGREARSQQTIQISRQVRRTRNLTERMRHLAGTLRNTYGPDESDGAATASTRPTELRPTFRPASPDSQRSSTAAYLSEMRDQLFGQQQEVRAPLSPSPPESLFDPADLVEGRRRHSPPELAVNYDSTDEGPYQELVEALSAHTDWRLDRRNRGNDMLLAGSANGNDAVERHGGDRPALPMHINRTPPPRPPHPRPLSPLRSAENLQRQQRRAPGSYVLHLDDSDDIADEEFWSGMPNFPQREARTLGADPATHASTSAPHRAPPAARSMPLPRANASAGPQRAGVGLGGPRHRYGHGPHKGVHRQARTLHQDPPEHMMDRDSEVETVLADDDWFNTVAGRAQQQPRTGPENSSASFDEEELFSSSGSLSSLHEFSDGEHSSAASESGSAADGYGSSGRRNSGPIIRNGTTPLPSAHSSAGRFERVASGTHTESEVDVDDDSVVEARKAGRPRSLSAWHVRQERKDDANEADVGEGDAADIEDGPSTKSRKGKQKAGRVIRRGAARPVPGEAEPQSRQKATKRRRPRYEDPDFVDDRGCPQLVYFASKGDATACRKLLLRGASVTSSDAHGNTAVHEAAKHGHVETLGLLLNPPARARQQQQQQTQTQTQTQDGESQDIADSRLVRQLCSPVPNVNARTHSSHQTPLHQATANGDIAVVRLLLDHGASTSVVNSRQLTPLDTCSNEKIARLLTDRAKAQRHISARDKAGQSKLHRACNAGDTELTVDLVNQGADINMKDNAGWTPLHEAALEGHNAVVTALLRRGADFSARGFGGDTPLHDACANGHVDVLSPAKQKASKSKRPPTHSRHEDAHESSPSSSAASKRELVSLKRLREEAEKPLVNYYFSSTSSKLSRDERKLQVLMNTIERMEQRKPKGRRRASNEDMGQDAAQDDPGEMVVQDAGTQYDPRDPNAAVPSGQSPNRRHGRPSKKRTAEYEEDEEGNASNVAVDRKSQKQRPGAKRSRHITDKSGVCAGDDGNVALSGHHGVITIDGSGRKTSTPPPPPHSALFGDVRTTASATIAIKSEPASSGHTIVHAPSLSSSARPARVSSSTKSTARRSQAAGRRGKAQRRHTEGGRTIVEDATHTQRADALTPSAIAAQAIRYLPLYTIQLHTDPPTSKLDYFVVDLQIRLLLGMPVDTPTSEDSDDDPSDLNPLFQAYPYLCRQRVTEPQKERLWGPLAGMFVSNMRYIHESASSLPDDSAPLGGTEKPSKTESKENRSENLQNGISAKGCGSPGPDSELVSKFTLHEKSRFVKLDLFFVKLDEVVKIIRQDYSQISKQLITITLDLSTIGLASAAAASSSPATPSAMSRPRLVAEKSPQRKPARPVWDGPQRMLPLRYALKLHYQDQLDYLNHKDGDSA